MEALGLNLIDWIIVIVLLASGVLSFTRGITKEVLSILLWFAAFIAAISLEYIATPRVNEVVGNEEISKIISYVIVFTLFIVLGRIVIRYITKFLEWSGASGFDRFFGVIFGLIRGTTILLAIFLLLPANFKSTDAVNNSKITPLLQKYAPRIESYFRALIESKDEVTNKAIEITKPITEQVEELIEGDTPQDNKNSQDKDS